ncbi:MAG: hypothetical protein IT429_00635 [Gemmataceae bacterium]|nr:hypothetical protein [Gemmataceae bacterium]
MRRIQPLAALLFIPTLALFLATPGCGKKEEPKPGDGAAKADTSKSADKGDGDMTEVASTGWGRLVGTVTYDGEPPAPQPLNITKGHEDAKACHDTTDKSQLIDQTWIVNQKNKGVQYTVVFLKAPENKFFKIKEEDRKPKDVTLSQPHCVFLPHVFVAFPAYYDKAEKGLKRTGQKIVVINDAKFNHNTNFTGDPSEVKGGNKLLPPGTTMDIKATDIGPSYTVPISFKCDIHPWMSAKCWALDHPYAAVTDKDGKYEIKNVPAGAKVTVVGWHQGTGKGGFFKEQEMDLKEGDNTLDLKVKK